MAKTKKGHGTGVILLLLLMLEKTNQLSQTLKLHHFIFI